MVVKCVQVRGLGLSESEEAVVQRFLLSGAQASRTLADIIMEKIKEKTEKSTSLSAGASMCIQ